MTVTARSYEGPGAELLYRWGRALLLWRVGWSIVVLSGVEGRVMSTAAIGGFFGD